MYYFIVNPSSGGGQGKKVWQAVKAELENRHVPFRMFGLHYNGEARQIAGKLSELRHSFTAVIIGGDGTINEFIDGLATFEYITLGCIPTGSGNDFVRGLSLKNDVPGALSAVLSPQEIRYIKVGQVHTAVEKQAGNILPHAFIVSSGIGFDADVCNGAFRSGAKQLLNFFHAGKLIYLATALRLLLSMRQYRAKLTLEDGKELAFDQMFFAAVMNLRYEGGGFMFAPDANPESEAFQVVIAEGLTRARILRLLPLALVGKHTGKKGIHILRCRSITVQACVPLCVHTDGEIFGFHDSVTFEARPERLRIITR